MIHKLFDSIFRLFGYVPKYREHLLLQEVLLLEQQVSTYEQENARLLDENTSLWDMMDEMKKSDIMQNKEAMKSFMDDLQDTLTDEMLKDFKPVGEA
jgi:regulator of replication initiation timing